MALGAPFDEQFSRHVVDDLALPVLTRNRQGEA
jgi:hypothetical protein